MPHEPSPVALPEITSLLQPVVSRRLDSEAALMRSEVELQVGAGPHSPRGRAWPPSQVSCLEPDLGKAPEAPEPLAAGRVAHNWECKVLEINGLVEELGR